MPLENGSLRKQPSSVEKASIACAAGEAERLAPRKAVHGAVWEREQRQRRGQGDLPRGEADAVHVRGQVAEDQAGQL